MANTTVEFLGGQLDGALLSNAASEATLQEIVKALGTSAGGGGGGSGSSGGGGGRGIIGSLLLTPFGLLGKAVGLAGGQFMNVAGASGTMAKMLLDGQNQLSQYTTVLNNQVIRQLPLVGRYLGAFGGVINSGIQQLEGWNSTLQRLTSSGATFNNSIIQMMNASASTWMSLDEFASMVQQNSHKLVRFGSTVSEGTQAFADLSNYLLKSGGYARETLIEMGFSVNQVNQDLIDYMDVVYRGMGNEVQDREALGRSFVNYRLHVDTLTRLTGKQMDQIQQEMEATSNDVVYRLRNSQLQTQTQKDQMHLLLTTYTTMFGENGAEMFRAARAGVMSSNPAIAYLNAQMPGLYDEMRGLQDRVVAGALSQDQMDNEVRGIYKRAITGGIEAFRTFGGIYNAAAAGNRDAQEFADAFSPVLNVLARMGINLETATEEDLDAAIETALQEQRSRGQLTDFLREFEMAMREFKTGFMRFLTRKDGPLDRLSKWLEEFNASGKMEELGAKFGKFVAEYLPMLGEFLGKFVTPAGREMLMNSLAYMFKVMGVYLQHYLPTIWGREVNQDDLNNDLNTLAAQHDQAQAMLAPQHAQQLDRLTNRDEDNPGAGDGGPSTAPPVINNPEMARRSGRVYMDNTGSVRSGDITDRLHDIISQAAADAGVSAHVVSGGQPDYSTMPPGSVQAVSQFGDPGWQSSGFQKKEWIYRDSQGRWRSAGRIGTQAHDGGHAADMEIRHAGGGLVGLDDPAMAMFVAAARSYGALGMGAGPGYMGANRVHIDTRNHTGGRINTWGGHTGLSHAFGYDKATGTDLGGPQMRFGTLGTMGSLFSSFGGGTEVDFHGEEAVLTPPEMDAVLRGTSDASILGDIGELLSNVQILVSLSERRLRLATDLKNQTASRSRNNWDMVTS